MSSPSKLVVSTHTVACPSSSKTKTKIFENLIKAAEKESRTQTKCKIVLSIVGVFYQHVLVGSMGNNRSTENDGSLGQKLWHAIIFVLKIFEILIMPYSGCNSLRAD